VLYSYAASEGFPLASFNNIVNKLRMIIKSHSEYDFVIIDSPPSLDNIPELMIRVADYVFTPVISQLPVYRSTLKFYKNISQIYNQEKELIEVLDRMNSNIPVDSEYSADDLQLINDICTRIGVDSIVKHVPRLITFVTKFGSDKAHKIIKDAYIDAIGQSTENGITLLSSIINDSRAINEASVENNSVYEAIPSRSRAKILKQTKENLDELYSEFLNLIICEHNHE
jgi:cellulose biosynthesis protein BcsQ